MQCDFCSHRKADQAKCLMCENKACEGWSDHCCHCWSKLRTKQEDVLHIYAQGSYHEESFIVGDRTSLQNLAKSIQKALDSGSDTFESMTADGEGFPILVVCHEDSWDNMCLPYTDDFAKDNRETVIWPYYLPCVKQEYAKMRERKGLKKKEPAINEDKINLMTERVVPSHDALLFLFDDLAQDNFQMEVGVEFPPAAMRIRFQKLPRYQLFVDTFKAALGARSVFESFLNNILANLKPGIKSRFDLCLAFLAVVLEENPAQWAEDFLRSLADNKLAELSLTHMVAAECLKHRNDSDSPNIDPGCY